MSQELQSERQGASSGADSLFVAGVTGVDPFTGLRMTTVIERTWGRC